MLIHELVVGSTSTIDRVKTAAADARALELAAVVAVVAADATAHVVGLAVVFATGSTEQRKLAQKQAYDVAVVVVVVVAAATDSVAAAAAAERSACYSVFQPDYTVVAVSLAAAPAALHC